MNPIYIADRMALDVGRTTGEIDLRAIAEHLDVRGIEPAPMCAEGCLIRCRDGTFRISYRQDRPRTRRRFTVAHELAHIIIERTMGVTLPSRVERKATTYSKIEQLADRVAASLLMPSEQFIDRLRQHCTIDKDEIGRVRRKYAVDELARSFRVSRTAVFRRLLEVQPVMTVWFRVELSEETHADEPPLYSYDRTSDLRLCSNELSVACRFLHESRDRRAHEIEVDTPYGRRMLKCDGWAQRGLGRNSDSIEYWVVGWTWGNADWESCDDSEEV